MLIVRQITWIAGDDDRETLVEPLRERWFIKTATNSEALKSRAREMRDNFTRVLAVLLAETVRRPADDPMPISQLH